MLEEILVLLETTDLLIFLALILLLISFSYIFIKEGD